MAEVRYKMKRSAGLPQKHIFEAKNRVLPARTECSGYVEAVMRKFQKFGGPNREMCSISRADELWVEARKLLIQQYKSGSKRS
jgi:hypothetical protein